MLGLTFDIVPANIDEQRHSGEEPSSFVERMAQEKTRLVSQQFPGRLAVGGDTVVSFGGKVLEKPRDQQEAAQMLNALSGKTHRVYTGMALGRRERFVSLVATACVRFRSFSGRWAEEYAASGEPMDKAGAYGIQGPGSAMVERVEGDYYAVVGFSVAGFATLLRQLDLRYRPGRIERA